MNLSEFNENLEKQKRPTDEQAYQYVYQGMRDYRDSKANKDASDEEIIEYCATELMYDFEQEYGENSADDYDWYRKIKKAAKFLSIDTSGSMVD